MHIQKVFLGHPIIDNIFIMLQSKKCENFDDLRVISRDTHTDSRGEFYKIFNLDDLKKFGWNDSVKQINFSQSFKKGTVRGMHMQFSKYAEYKLVTCIKGSIFDVAIDLRKEKKTYLKFFSIQLDHVNKLSLMIPPGFAHGFQVLEEDSQIIYTHSKEYSNKFEGGISPLDPDINVAWPLPVIGLSDRDKKLPLSKDFIKNKS